MRSSPQVGLTRHLAPAAAALALVITGPVRASLELAHLPKELVLAALAAGLAFALRRKALALDRLDYALVAVAAGTIASAAFARSPAFAWRPALLVLALVTLAIAVREGEDRHLWLRWLGGALSLLALLGLVEAVDLVRWSLPGRAPASLLGQRNTLAHVLVLGSVIFWKLTLTAASPRERLLWLAATAMAAAVVVMTRSRAAWLAAPLVLLTFRSLKVTLVVASGALAAALAPVFLPWKTSRPYFDSLTRIFDATSGSGAGRLDQWRHALSQWSDAPLLGVGPGNAVLLMPREPNRFLTSDVVALLTERGLVGVALGLTAVAYWLWYGRGRREGLAVTVAAAAMGLFDAVVQLPPGAVVLFSVVFVALPRRAAVVRAVRWPALITAAVLALGAFGLSLAFASRLVSSGSDAGVDGLSRAVQLDPTDALTRLELTRALVAAGRCDEARGHLPTLERELPGHAGLKETRAAFDSSCGPH